MSWQERLKGGIEWVHTHDIFHGGRTFPVMQIPTPDITLCFRSDGQIEWLINGGRPLFRGEHKPNTEIVTIRRVEFDSLPEHTLRLLPGETSR